jgi:hypothetical protein
VNLVVFWDRDRYGKQEPVYLVTDLPADQVQARYGLRMLIEEDFRDLKTTLGLKRLRPRKNVVERVGRLLLVAMVAACVAGHFYPCALAERSRVVRRQSDVRFVAPVVLVCRLVWAGHTSGAGWKSSSALAPEHLGLQQQLQECGVFASKTKEDPGAYLSGRFR